MTGPRLKFDESANLTLVRKAENPRREGSSRWRDYEIWKKAGTVGEALKLGATMESIKRDIRKGLIAVGRK